MLLPIQAMKFSFRCAALILVWAVIPVFLFAQSLSSYGSSGISDKPVKTTLQGSFAGTWEAGVMLGPDFYYGDLNASKFLSNRSVSATGGFFLMRQFSNTIGLKGILLIGGLHGSKDGTEESLPVNWMFKGVFLDLTINSVFNLSNIFSPYHEGRRIFVYGSIGLGINAWNTRLTKTLNGTITDPPQANRMQAGLVLPVGLGLQYAITNRINAGVEYTLRTIFSDNVDQTVGGFKWDVVNMLAITASYRFGVAKKKLTVQEYPYANPQTYRQNTPEPEPYKPGVEIPSASETYDYVVQVCAFSKHDYTVAWVKRHYRVDLPLKKESNDGLNRYVIGHNYKDLNSAKELCDRLRKQGIHDAWVIAYKNGVRHHVVVY